MTPNEQTITEVRGSLANYDPFIYELPCWLKPKRRREPAELAGLDMVGEQEQEL